MITNPETTLSSLLGDHGGRLLDLASGPSLMQVMSASHHFNDITLAEYTQANRELTQKWIDRDPQAYDWTEYFKFVAEMEGDM